MTLRILLADDEPDIRTIVRLRLEREGWTVEEVSSGYEALGACRQRPPEVLVLDQRMGGFTGIEVATILRGEGFMQPVIIFSAYLDASLETEAASSGFVAVSKSDIPRLIEEVSAHHNEDPSGIEC